MTGTDFAEKLRRVPLSLSVSLTCLSFQYLGPLSLSLCTPRRSSTSGTCDSKEPNARLKIAPQLLQRVVLTLVVYDPGPTDDPTDWFHRVSQTQLRRTAITRSRHALTAVDKLTDHVCLCNQCCHDHTETRSSHRQLRHVQGAPPPLPRGTHHLVDAAYLKSSVRQSIWLHHVFQAQQIIPTDQVDSTVPVRNCVFWFAHRQARQLPAELAWLCHICFGRIFAFILSAIISNLHHLIVTGSFPCRHL